MFQNIACILDDATSVEHLPQHLYKPFREFVADLTSVARRHFDSHVRGSARPPHPYLAPRSLPIAQEKGSVVTNVGMCHSSQNPSALAGD